MRTPSRIAFVVALLALSAAWLLWSDPAPHSPTRIWTAQRIITMEESIPTATAIAVGGGKILALGTLAEVRSALDDETAEVDDRFAGKVLLPGFIDPHLHPTLAATILQLEIVSAMAWETPRGATRAVRGHADFLDRLRELDRELPEDEWLLTWGYHFPYHGELSRRDLDTISSERPIVVWQRSVHEVFLNSRALEEAGLDEAAFAGHAQADWEGGHLWESSLFTLGQPIMNRLTSPASYLEGLSLMSEVLHRGGLTTVAEQGFPSLNAVGEFLALHYELSGGLTGEPAPFRFVLVPNAMYLTRKEGSVEAAERAAERMLRYSTDRIQIVKHAKYFADGAIYSQLMQMSEPYLDDPDHHGEWLMEPDLQAEVLRTFTDQGWDIHIHVNGDAALDVLLEQVASLRTNRSDPRPRIILEHYGYARDDQHQRLRDLDVEVSNNAYYVHELAPIYSRFGMGPERAADISPLGGLARAGVPFSFHSDFPMAPAKPLTLVWAALNRIGSDGNTWGEDQKVSLDLALRAVTVEAARSLGLEHEIGSIRVGKKADFTVLEADPYTVDPVAIKDIEIWGTILEGRMHPLPPHTLRN